MGISNPTISASLIIKNEEAMLPKCLKSIKGVDEIVIVDTGSEDKSIQIAKKAGAKVYTDYKWNDNFAEARNESKKHCTKEWLLIIDGDEALEKVFQEHPRCIVLDVVLPKQNGFQLCRKLKSLDASKDIPIILLTSKNTPLDRSWGMRQGADMFMTKPFNEDDLVDNVRRLV